LNRLRFVTQDPTRKFWPDQHLAVATG
jgi:hypothetical protein